MAAIFKSLNVIFSSAPGLWWSSTSLSVTELFSCWVAHKVENICPYWNRTLKSDMRLPWTFIKIQGEPLGTPCEAHVYVIFVYISCVSAPTYLKWLKFLMKNHDGPTRWYTVILYDWDHIRASLGHNRAML